ncbi:type IV pilus twitching motility protein PilT [Paraliomyxa miuraensis]|uniref:type IV pilus twitching motility protein PilT n=1 Tax=Paraliomyxa miuraensis TaxID=376150 RepID=UPI00224E9E3B|nr:PilT/PilU family type 4a pilus ATPase [Paraliomyxa miuraensis]MCX4240937.1 PilT/PilU family type 4a pilus ATPase [Paraliomyxa miuraensis]
MSKLAQLLSYLERPGVTELVFRSGEAAVMHSGTHVHPLTVTPLQANQIQRFFEGTPVLTHLPKGPGVPSQTLPMDLLGGRYVVSMSSGGAPLEIRVAKPRAAASTWTDIPEAELPEGMGRRPRKRNLTPPPMEPSTLRDAVTARDLPRHGSATSTPATSDSAIGLTNPEAIPEPSHEVATQRYRAVKPTPAPIPVPAAPEPEPEPPPPPAPTPTLATPRRRPRVGGTVDEALREHLITARRQAASDVHVVAADPVRFRRAGALEPMGEPISAAGVEAMVLPLLNPEQAEQLERLGYADLAADVEGAGRVRINVSRQRTGLKICLRLVASQPPSLESLGLPPEVRGLAKHHQGLVIVAGPNGHGKTTSMAALIDMFNASHPMHIITVEDPVEVVHPRKQAIVTQREVGTHTRSFARALAGALREDPDVIAIGELRDRETVEMALAASETGHLVIATMSTPSAAKTIDRLIDMFPPDDQAQVRATLAGSLKLVLSQRLVRRADGRGLVAAFEMITGGIALWALVRDDKLYQLPSLLQRGRSFGMISLESSLRELLQGGVITRQEALAHATDPKAFAHEDPRPR